MKATEIYNKIINKFGDREQVVVAIEELSELQKALCKVLRYGCNFDEINHNVIEEIADVRIMIGQLQIIFGCEELVQKEMAKKLQRTIDRYLL